MSNTSTHKITGMRKVILNVAVSLDGFIEGANGEYDWCFADQDYGMNAFLNRTDSIFIGRKSYELLERIDGKSWPDKKRYVFSGTLTTVAENAVLVSGDIAEKVQAIKNENGKDIWLFGGANLTTFFLNAGLIDELLLSIHPIILGKGKPLFVNIHEPVKLKYLSTETYNTGLVQVSYEI